MNDRSRSTIICVDDEKMLLNILAEQLTEWVGKNYTIEKALGAEEALAILDECEEEGVDVSVVISDYIMPNMKGDELLEKVKDRNPRIKKIMLTGYSSIDGIISAINRAGLYRYITKPWDNRDLALTVIEAIKAFEQEKKSADLSRGFETLYKRYEKLYMDLQGNYDQTIKALTVGLDMRDPKMAGHSSRVANNAVEIGKKLKSSDLDLKRLEHTAIIHDIGKIGLSDDQIKELSGLQLYSKPEIVKKQNEVAENIIKNMVDTDKIIESIKYHWEKFDGTGIYGLRGKQIPLDAQILGICNYYDLMSSNIAQGQMLPPEAAAKIMNNTSGTIFDPTLVSVFVGLLQQGTIR